MSRFSKSVAATTDPAGGWDARLWRLWALYSALAYTIILGLILALTSLGLDVTRIAVNDRFVGTVLIATFGALLYGGVLGSLQWRVLRQRVPIPRRPWVLACIVPALIVWSFVVVPAAISAESSDESLRVAYFLAISQALTLGPLIGFSQAKALQPYTRRWRWWIPANLASWLIVYAVFSLVALLTGAFDFAHGEGSPLEAFVVLIVAAPLSGRFMLWVTAPAAIVQVPEPGASAARASGSAHPRRTP